MAMLYPLGTTALPQYVLRVNGGWPSAMLLLSVTLVGRISRSRSVA
jgi:hypothetical protein